jgi:hypothetical protein
MSNQTQVTINQRRAVDTAMGRLDLHPLYDFMTARGVENNAEARQAVDGLVRAIVSRGVAAGVEEAIAAVQRAAGPSGFSVEVRPDS